MKIQQCILMVSCIGLFSCAQLSALNKSDTLPSTVVIQNKPSLESNSFHAYIEQIAKQLFDTSQNIDINKTIAVGTFLPTYNDGGKTLPDTATFGLQVQESMMTFATQAGLRVIEFKTMPTIKVGEGQDKMLSRDLSELSTHIDVEYFLTGSFTNQQQGIMVNARLIRVPGNILVAAATDYIPKTSMWSHSKVTMKDHHIYRSEY